MEGKALREEVEGSLASVKFACSEQKYVLDGFADSLDGLDGVPVQALLTVHLRPLTTTSSSSPSPAEKKEEAVDVACCLPRGYVLLTRSSSGRLCPALVDPVVFDETLSGLLTRTQPVYQSLFRKALTDKLSALALSPSDEVEKKNKSDKEAVVATKKDSSDSSSAADKKKKDEKGWRAPALFIPHGGGPMPLLGEPSHAGMVKWLRGVASNWKHTPRAICVVSAHWETDGAPNVYVRADNSLLFDYSGFPAQTYELKYPAKGAPKLGALTVDLLREAGWKKASAEKSRGLDHGSFIPLLLMFPEAQIPVFQVSLLSSLDAAAHVRLGSALSKLRDQGVLILGSGMSFHNFGIPASQKESASQVFDRWLTDTCSSTKLSHSQRLQSLTDWTKAPSARLCHRREEHLLPLMVCAGSSKGGQPGQIVFRDQMMGARVSAIEFAD